jgi:hypothetical protein
MFRVKPKVIVVSKAEMRNEERSLFETDDS